MRWVAGNGGREHGQSRAGAATPHGRIQELLTLEQKAPRRPVPDPARGLIIISETQATKSRNFGQNGFGADTRAEPYTLLAARFGALGLEHE
jgi:hypothetical protein